ncbi:MAG: aldo/keto reductase [Saprospiraceae bacterium]|nr:aldo/keto reductase [Saprospiraceae bacterium]
MNQPQLILGTAMWGWTCPKEQCFELLDTFYQEGFREVDAATNYPLNGNTDQFRLSENILKEWIDTHGVRDLKVMIKVGSLTNVRTPENNLTKSFLLMMLDEYRFLFGESLDTYMIHWDNRDNKTEIQESLEAMQIAAEHGLRIGLSGIKHPKIYQALNQDFGFDFRIQIKHNLLQSAYAHYAPFHGQTRFITYGINAGGIKLDISEYHEQSSLKARGGNVEAEAPIVAKLRPIIAQANKRTDRPQITNFNHCGMTYAFHSPDISGILLGTSRTTQLQQSITFYRLLKQGMYFDFYDQLKDLA